MPPPLSAAAASAHAATAALAGLVALPLLTRGGEVLVDLRHEGLDVVAFVLVQVPDAAEVDRGVGSGDRRRRGVGRRCARRRGVGAGCAGGCGQSRDREHEDDPVE